jgi:inner membrane transporter RhtA
LFAAVLLLAIWRPSLRGLGREPEQLRLLLAFGVALAAMNLCFYLALDRIPTGRAVTF